MKYRNNNDDVLSFTQLKEMALRGRDKTKGKVIKEYYYLYYDPILNIVNLYDKYMVKSRPHDDMYRLAFTDSNDNTTITVPDDHSALTSIKVLLTNLYGIALTNIRGHKSIKEMNNMWILIRNHKAQCWEKFVYVPNGIVINNKQLVSAAPYNEVSVDNTWNNAYTQKSRKIRELIQALHILIPISKEKQEEAIAHFNKLSPRTNMIDILLTNPVNSVLVHYIRAISPASDQYIREIDFRKLLQTVINDYRYTAASLNNKLMIYAKDNINKNV